MSDRVIELESELALAKATVAELQEQSLSWEKRAFELGEQQDGLVKALNEEIEQHDVDIRILIEDHNAKVAALKAENAELRKQLAEAIFPQPSSD